MVARRDCQASSVLPLPPRMPSGTVSRTSPRTNLVGWLTLWYPPALLRSRRSTNGCRASVVRAAARCLESQVRPAVPPLFPLQTAEGWPFVSPSQELLLLLVSLVQPSFCRSAIAAIGGPGGRGYDGAAYASATELDWDVTELRRTLCCASRSLGCVGQRAVFADDAETATVCCEQLLTFVTMPDDPGYLLPSLLQLTSIRENAAHALLRLAAHTTSGPCWTLPTVVGATDRGFGFGGIGHGTRIVALALERLRVGGDGGRARAAVLAAMEQRL